MHSGEPSRLVGEAMKVLGPLAEERGIQALAPAQRAIVLLVWASGIIGNGGFRYFYEGAYFRNDVNHVPMLAEAFKLLGFDQAAEATLRSLAFFPAEIPNLGPVETNRHMEARGEKEVKKFFGPLDREVWELNRNGRLDAGLAELISREGIFQGVRGDA